MPQELLQRVCEDAVSARHGEELVVRARPPPSSASSHPVLVLVSLSPSSPPRVLVLVPGDHSQR